MNRFTKRVLILAIFVLCLFGLTILGAAAASTDGFETDAAAIEAGKVARIGGTATSNDGATYYATLNEALDAIDAADQTIYLITNYTQANSIGGHDIKPDAAGTAAYNFKLSSIDPENITLTVGTDWLFDLGGASTIVPTLENIKIDVGTKNLGYFNYVKLIINAGTTITGAGNSSGLINCENGANAITINGGTFIPTGTNPVINMKGNATVTINGGNFKTGYWAHGVGSSKLTVAGGTFTMADDVTDTTTKFRGIFMEASTTFTMTGGTFNVTRANSENIIRADGAATFSGGSVTTNTTDGALGNNPLRFAATTTVSGSFALTSNYGGGTIYIASGTTTISGGTFVGHLKNQIILGAAKITGGTFTHDGSGHIIVGGATVNAGTFTHSGSGYILYNSGSGSRLTAAGGLFVHTGTGCIGGVNNAAAELLLTGGTYIHEGSTTTHTSSAAGYILYRGSGAIRVEGADANNPVLLIAKNQNYIIEQGYQNPIAGLTDGGKLTIKNAYLSTERTDKCICAEESSYIILENILLDDDATALALTWRTDYADATPVSKIIKARVIAAGAATKQITIPAYGANSESTKTVACGYSSSALSYSVKVVLSSGLTVYSDSADTLATYAAENGFPVKVVFADASCIFVADLTTAIEEHVAQGTKVYNVGATDASEHIYSGLVYDNNTFTLYSNEEVDVSEYAPSSYVAEYGGVQYETIEEADAAAMADGMAFRDSIYMPTYYATYADIVAAINAKGAGAYIIYILADYSGAGANINLNAAGWNITLLGVGATAPKLTFTDTTSPFSMNASSISVTLENVEITVGSHIVLSDGNSATNSKFIVKSGTIIRTAATFGNVLFYLYDPCDVTIEAGAKIDTTGTTFSKDFNLFSLATSWASTLTVNGEILLGGTSNNTQIRVFSATDGFPNAKIVTSDTTKITLSVSGAKKDTTGIFVAYGNIEINGGTFKIASNVSGYLVVTNGANSSTVKITGNTVMIHEGDGTILNRIGGNLGVITVDSTSAQLIAKNEATVFRSPYWIVIKGAYLSCEASSPFVTEAVHISLLNVKFPDAATAAKFGTIVAKVGVGTETITVEGQSVNALSGFYFKSSYVGAPAEALAAATAAGKTVQLVAGGYTTYVASLAEAVNNIVAGAKIYDTGANDESTATAANLNGVEFTIYAAETVNVGDIVTVVVEYNGVSYTTFALADAAAAADGMLCRVGTTYYNNVVTAFRAATADSELYLLDGASASLTITIGGKSVTLFTVDVSNIDALHILCGALVKLTNATSVFAVGEVEGVYYDNFADAMAAADGKVLNLLDNVDIGAASYAIDGADVAINGNGYTISMDGTANHFALANGASLAVANVTISSAGKVFDLGAGENALTLDADTTVTGAMTVADARITVSAGTATITVAEGAKLEVSEGSTEDFAVISVAEGAKIVYEQAGTVEVDTDTEATFIDDANTASQGSSYTFNADSVVDFTAGSGTLFNTNEKVTLDNMLLNANGADLGNAELGPNMAISNDEQAIQSGYKFRIGEVAEQKYYKTWAEVKAAINAAGTYNVFVLVDTTETAATLTLGQNYKITISGVDKGDGTYTALTFTGSTTLFVLNSTGTALTIQNITMTFAGQFLTTDSNNGDSYFTLAAGAVLKTAASIGGDQLFQIYDPATLTFAAGSKVDTSATTFTKTWHMFVIDSTHFNGGKIILNGEILFGGQSSSGYQHRMFNATSGFKGEIEVNSPAVITYDVRGAAKDTSGIFIAYGEINIKGGTLKVTAATNGGYIVCHNGAVGDVMITGNTVMIHESAGVILNRNGGSTNPLITVNSENVQLIAKGAATIFTSPYYIHIIGAYMSCEATSPYVKEATHATFINVKFPTAEMAAKFGYQLRVDNATVALTVEGETVNALAGYYYSAANYKDVLYEAIKAIPGDSAQHTITLYSNLTTKTAYQLVGTAAGSHKILIQSADGKSYTITEAIDAFWLVMKAGAQVTFRNVKITSNGALVQVDAGGTETILTFAENTQVTMNGAIKGAIAIDLWNNAQFNLNSGASITVPATADLAGDFYAIKVESSFKNSVNLAGDITISASANAENRIQRIVETVSGFTGTVNFTAGNYIIDSGKSTASSAIINNYGNVNITGGVLKITNNSLGMIISARAGSAKVSGTAHLEHTGTATATDHCFVLYRYGGSNAIEVDGADVKLFARGKAVILEQGYGVKHIKNCTIYSESGLLVEEEGSYCPFQNIKFTSLEEAQRIYTAQMGNGKRTALVSVFFGTLNGSEGYYESYYMFNKVTNPVIGLIGDLELNHGWLPSGKSCTIDGNGFTMTLTKGSGGANAMVLENGATVTFKDITVIAANGYAARIYADSHLILDEGAHLISYAYSGTNRGIQVDSTGRLTIKAGAKFGIPADYQTQLTAGYNVINCSSNWTGTVDIAGELYAKHTTNDWTFPVRVYDGAAGQLIVRSTAVIIQATTGLSSNACLMFSNSQAGTLVKVEEGATFNTSTGKVGYCYNMPSIADDYTAAALGFSFRVGNATKEVHGQTVYANYYSNFGNAYADVANNGTVFVLGDFDFANGVATFDGKTVTFKGVKNGGVWPTIKMDGSTYHFKPVNGACVTFEDLNIYTKGRFAQPQAGTGKTTIIFAGETLLTSPMSVGDCLFSLAGNALAEIIIRENAAIGIDDGGAAGNTYVVYMNGGSTLTITIEGGFFNYADKANGTAGLHNGVYAPAANNEVTLTIKPTAYLYHGSKKVTDGSSLFRIAGTITVDGGHFVNELAPIFLLSEGSTLNVKEGMFTSSGANSTGAIATLGVATVNIYGGYFEGMGISTLSVANGSVYNIYGGAFNYISDADGVVISTGYGDTEGTLNVFGGAFRSVSKTAPIFAALSSTKNQFNLKCFVASSYANLITNIGTGYRTSDHFDALLGRSTLNGFEVTTGADPVFAAGKMAMQFKATLSKTAVEQAIALADDSVTLGMLAIPTALYEELIASVGSEAVPYHMFLDGMTDVIDIVADMENDVTFEGDGCVTIRVTLADVDPDTAYSVIFYAKYDVDGNEVYNYSDYVSSKNSRSMAQVARAALNDLSDEQSVDYPNATSGGKYSPYTAEQQAILLTVCGGNAALLPLDLYVVAGGSSAAGNTALTEWQMGNAEVGFANIFSSGFITSAATQSYGGRRFQQTTRKYTPAGTLVWVGQGIGPDMIGPELGMAAALADYYTAGSGKYAAVLKYTTEDLSMSKITSYYNLLTEAIQNEIETYRIMGYDVNIVGAYWMQGEADYDNASVVRTYSTKFNALVNDLRADLGEMVDADLSAMPVVVGEIGISYTKSTTENEVAFIEMQNELDEIVGLDNIYVVNSSEFTSNNDIFIDMKDVVLNGEIVATTLMANGAHRSGATSITIPEIEMLVELIVVVDELPVSVPMRSIAKALYLAPDGATVKLLADMEESVTFVLDGVNDITLDGNNGQFGIVSTANDAAILVSNTNMVFKDFKIEYNSAPEAVAVQIADNATVVFTGNSNVVTGGTAFVLDGKDAKLTVDGATINAVNDAIYAINGNVTVADGVVSSMMGACVVVDIDAAYRLVVNIKGGEFNATDVAIANNSMYAVLVISNSATINADVVNAGFGSGNPEYDIFAA